MIKGRANNRALWDAAKQVQRREKRNYFAFNTERTRGRIKSEPVRDSSSSTEKCLTAGLKTSVQILHNAMSVVYQIIVPVIPNHKERQIQ